MILGVTLWVLHLSLSILQANIDLKRFWEAIRVSSGTSFSWETAAPFIFNQNYESDFTIDLHCKDFALGKTSKILVLFEKKQKQNSPPAWPQEAYRPSRYRPWDQLYGEGGGVTVWSPLIKGVPLRSSLVQREDKLLYGASCTERGGVTLWSSLYRRKGISIWTIPRGWGRAIPLVTTLIFARQTDIC